MVKPALSATESSRNTQKCIRSQKDNAGGSKSNEKQETESEYHDELRYVSIANELSF